MPQLIVKQLKYNLTPVAGGGHGDRCDLSGDPWSRLPDLSPCPRKTLPAQVRVSLQLQLQAQAQAQAQTQAQAGATLP